jgi:putative transport protein
MSVLLAEEMFVLFAILAIGSWIGQLSVRRVSLGSSAVFFVALIFGHFGFSIPRAVTDLGLLLFMYAVGLQAGPRFFRTFRRQGQQFVIIALVMVLAGAAVTAGLTWLLHLPFELAAGLFTGALTNTPGLAAAIDAVGRIAPARVAAVSVGYGIAYPFGLVLAVLTIQLLPRLLHRDLSNEEACWQQEQEAETPRLQAKRFLITNPNCDGLLLRELDAHRIGAVNISRVRHGDIISLARPDLILHVGDVAMAVGPESELAKLRVLLGEETDAPMDANTNVVSVDGEITETALAGKSLSDLKVWERYGVVITRIRRQGLELPPTGTSTLEMGDVLRVVGERAAVDGFAQVIGSARRADETNMLPFLAGLLLGITVGLIPFNLSSGIEIKLGIAGGAFIVSLLAGHFGRIGPLRLFVPPAAKNLSRELGLMLFLAGTGSAAGAQLVQILAQQGWQLLLACLLVSAVSMLAVLWLMDRYYRLNILCTMGALAGAMTSSPGLSAANAQTETDLPTLSYASIYPVALIFKIVGVQLLVEILRRVGT